MKIEKISNNQIRCTLTKQDLADRELKLSELAYGSEKAKSLFRDMMQQASYELGFEAEDIPLMIEAIPISEDCIILTVTKVENPDELDTRFSKFSAEQNENDSNLETLLPKGADEILDLYKRIQEEKRRLEQQKDDDFVPLDKAIKSKDEKKTKEESAGSDTSADESTSDNELSFNMVKLYEFNDIDTIGHLSLILKDFYNGNNSIYKDEFEHKYYLVLNKDHHTPEEFNKTCNILSEYGTQKQYTLGAEEFFKEHYTIITENNGIQLFASINL